MSDEFVSQQAKDAQARLKALLQADKKDADKYENLSAALIGRLLDVPVAVAKSGFQYGGDAGTAGQSKRRLRIETKKYADTTSLKDRELLGEFDQALGRDPALEAWILAATREAPEQLLQDLTLRGEKEGVPVVVLDWPDIEAVTPMATLCAFAPDLVDTLFSTEAGDAARDLAPYAGDAIELVRHRLQSWSLGYDALRTLSHQKLLEVWKSPRASNAELAQDAAGGADNRHTIRRVRVDAALSAWWSGKAQNDAPGVVIGWDGVGKTWAVIDWLNRQSDLQPIVLAVPSSAVATLSATAMGLKRFVGERLYELTQVRDPQHWLRRFEYLLERPLSEGPILTLYLDGLNQEPSAPWLPLLKVLQSLPFQGRVRVLVSTREHHYSDRLSYLNGLVVRGQKIEVEPYDTAPGGEFDQMLKLEGVDRAELRPDLIELARMPRLFSLVMRLRERLRGAEQVTLHRLLWEYGRDTLGVRAGRSFSEDDWRDWLRDVAEKYRSGVRSVQMRDLSEGADRPDLSEREVYARLSDIIDGRFVTREASGALSYGANVVNHALGAALLQLLDETQPADYDALEAELIAWLDPIAGWDAKAEILRAAVSIYVERGGDAANDMAAVLVTAWVHAQNVPDQHRHELIAFAENLVPALLSTVERSNPHTQESARAWSMYALKYVPRDNEDARALIFAACRRWFSIVSRDVERPDNPDKQAESRRAARFTNRVGVDTSGPLTVLGVPLQFIDRDYMSLSMAAPIIMEGFPLEAAWPVFEAAAVGHSVGHRDDAWDGLKWIVLFNDVDREATVARTRVLSADMSKRAPEPGVNSELSARSAALLLWLTGEDEDGVKANALNPPLDRQFDYKRDYLDDPTGSFFRIERRHGREVMDAPVSLRARTHKLQELVLDPTFEPTEKFVADVRAYAAQINVSKLNVSNSRAIEDHNFAEIEPFLARCASDLLAELTRRKMRETDLPKGARYWRAVHALESYLLVGDEEKTAARVRRQSGADSDAKHETHAATCLLLTAGTSASTFEQMSDILDADFKFIDADLKYVVGAACADDIDRLIDKYGEGTDRQKRHLVQLVSLHEVTLSEKAWAWFEAFIASDDADGIGVAYRVLYRTDAHRFGQALFARDWSWTHKLDVWSNQFGSAALMKATLSAPFEQIAPRLAPWLLLKAAQQRGDARDELALAADILERAIMRDLEPPDPGSTILIDRQERKDDPAFIAVRPNAEDRDPIAALRRATDGDELVRMRRSAVETAVERIKAARDEGASLYLTDIDASDFDGLIAQWRDRIEVWLEGAHGQTQGFRRRVLLSEGVYLALCEALLAKDPGHGVLLWRALRRVMTTRYIGPAGVDELLHLPFRAPDSPQVAELREEVLSLPECNTDQDLFQLALAASSNGRLDWLNDVIDRDAAHESTWRRMRAIVLSGFVPGAELPYDAAWQDGDWKSEHQHLRNQAALRRWREACARHWWKTFVEASDADTAYAAWVLFLKAADRRAWAFMRTTGETAETDTEFGKRKATHVELNRQRMKNQLAKADEKLDGDFLHRDIYIGVGPWRHIRDG